jgi:hypothetical protein
MFQKRELRRERMATCSGQESRGSQQPVDCRWRKPARGTQGPRCRAWCISVRRSTSPCAHDGAGSDVELAPNTLSAPWRVRRHRVSCCTRVRASRSTPSSHICSADTATTANSDRSNSSLNSSHSRGRAELRLNAALPAGELCARVATS